jgi:uncharacterized protein (TIGR04255 family)
MVRGWRQMSGTASSGTVLPHYRTPPVVEVIFAVALQPVSVTLVDLARFGIERLSQEFPLSQDQPAVRMTVESFDAAGENLVPTLSLLTGPGGPPVRLWFQSEDKTRLIQLQRDWFAYNWQGASGDDPYPRYEYIEGRFLQTWDMFSDFLAEHSAETAAVEQCELSYINHITPGDLWSHPGQVDRILRLAGRASGFLPEPEDSQVVSRYRIRHQDLDVGRLYVQATPGQRQSDRKPIIQLNVTVRGRPWAEGREGMISFFRLAHEWIVNGFAAVTTDEAQYGLWGRIT